MGKISDEDDRGIEGKMVVLKTTKRILKIPKTGQNPTDTPKEIQNIPTMHITYRNTDKYPSAFKSSPHFYPLRNVENISTTFKLKNMTFTSRRILDSLDNKHNTEHIYIYGQKTLHYALQTYFGFFDTEYILHKCVDFKNYQAASKVSYLDGHFSDSLGFQLTCFKQHMDASKWRQHLVEFDRIEPKKTVSEVPKVEQTFPKNTNPVSVISSSCSLESIKQFNDDVYSQGGYEEMCGEELSFLEQKIGRSRDTSIDNLNAILENVEAQAFVDKNTKVNLKTELIDKLEFNKSKVKKCGRLVEVVDISSDLTNLSLNSDLDLEPVNSNNEQTNLVTVTEATDSVEYSTDVIRKTVVNYVESLDVDIINSDGSSIPNITDIYKNNSLSHEFERLCPVLESTNLSDTSDETKKSFTCNSTETASNIIELASKVVEFYCSRPQILDNHILMQNILIKCMQFWLTNNLPVDVLENILLKNMDKYFYPLSILLFCKNFNNNLGEGMVKDSEAKKTQKSFEFLKQLSTKFCLQLCSMVLQNVNKA